MKPVLLALSLVLACAVLSCRHGSGKQAPPRGPLDILIFGPHPDDSAIGCTGVMVKGLEGGKRVGVVVVTNGDGYPEAAAQVAGKSEADLVPGDFLRIARIRQRQSRTALGRIGIRPGDHHFLGFPDSRLGVMRERGGAEPIRQPYTGKDRTYGAAFDDYPTSARGRPAPYTWEAAVDVVAGILRERRPKAVYVTAPGDSHPDHRAAYVLVRDAARASGYRGRFYAFLVHGTESGVSSEPERRPLNPDLIAFKREILREYAKNLGDVHDALHLKALPVETFWPVTID